MAGSHVEHEGSTCQVSVAVIQSIDQRHRDLAHLRDDVKLFRVQVAQGRLNLLYLGGYFAESTRELLTNTTKCVASFAQGLRQESHEAQESHAALEKLSESALKDDRAYTEAFESQQAMETRLSSLETQQARKESELMEYFQRLHVSLPLSLVAQPLALVDHAVNDPDGSFSGAPSVLKAYWDRKGDCGVYKERLNELHQDYQETIVARELSYDQERPPSTSDDHFERKFAEDRCRMSEDLQRSLSDIDALHARCLAAGINPETWLIKQTSEGTSGSTSSTSDGERGWHGYGTGVLLPTQVSEHVDPRLAHSESPIMTAPGASESASKHHLEHDIPNKTNGGNLVQQPSSNERIQEWLEGANAPSEQQSDFRSPGLPNFGKASDKVLRHCANSGSPLMTSPPP